MNTFLKTIVLLSALGLMSTIVTCAAESLSPKDGQHISVSHPSIISKPLRGNPSGKCGENLFWEIDSSSGVLSITGSGNMPNYGTKNTARPPWFTYKDFIKSLVVEDSVTSIGENAFRQLPSLTSAEIGESVIFIDDYAFYDSEALSSVYIPESVELIGRAVFSGCDKLEYEEYDNALYLGNNDNKYHALIYSKNNSITSCKIHSHTKVIAGGAFSFCKALQSIDIPGSVVSIGHSAFDRCSGLKSVVIPKSVISIEFATFRGCTSLTSITIPDSVVSIGNSAFTGCTSLTSLTIGKSVAYILDDAFSGCSALESVVIPDSVNSIGYCAFISCTDLKSVTLGSSVRFVDNYAFSDCPNLTSVSVRSSFISFEEDAFSGSDSIKYEEYDNALYLGSEDNKYSILMSAKNKSITSCEINERTKVINDKAFSGCDSLTSITIPDSVTHIGYKAFSGCDALETVEMSKSVTHIKDEAFSGCGNLASVTIPDSVVSVGYDAFDGCDKLKFEKYDNALYLGNEGNKYHVLISATDDSITSCTINDKTKVIADYAFSELEDLTSVTIGKSVSRIGREAFSGCKYLDTINIPDSVTSIGYGAFFDCNSLPFKKYRNATYLGNDKNAYYALISAIDDPITSCEIHANTKIIADYAFDRYSTLTSVSFGSSVTHIGEFAFYFDSLTSVTIPASVVSIESSAFEMCQYLLQIEYLGTSDPCNSSYNVFYGRIHVADIVVPEGYKDKQFCGIKLNTREIIVPSSSSSPSSSNISSGNVAKVSFGVFIAAAIAVLVTILI